MADKGSVDGMGKDHRVQSGFLKHIDILALFLLVGYVEDLVLMLLFILLQAVLQGQVFALQVLKENVIVHLLREFLIL